MKKLDLHNLPDQPTRENFSIIEDEIMNGFFTNFRGKFMRISLDDAGTFPIKHNLPFKPLDTILTSISNGAIATFNYDSFTKENISITVDKACEVRYYCGRYDGKDLSK